MTGCRRTAGQPVTVVHIDGEAAGEAGEAGLVSREAEMSEGRVEENPIGCVAASLALFPLALLLALVLSPLVLPDQGVEKLRALSRLALNPFFLLLAAAVFGGGYALFSLLTKRR